MNYRFFFRLIQCSILKKGYTETPNKRHSISHAA